MVHEIQSAYYSKSWSHIEVTVDNYSLQNVAKALVNSQRKVLHGRSDIKVYFDVMEYLNVRHVLIHETTISTPLPLNVLV